MSTDFRNAVESLEALMAAQLQKNHCKLHATMMEAALRLNMTAKTPQEKASTAGDIVRIVKQSQRCGECPISKLGGQEMITMGDELERDVRASMKPRGDA